MQLGKAPSNKFLEIPLPLIITMAGPKDINDIIWKSLFFIVDIRLHLKHIL